MDKQFKMVIVMILSSWILDKIDIAYQTHDLPSIISYSEVKIPKVSQIKANFKYPMYTTRCENTTYTTRRDKWICQKS